MGVLHDNRLEKVQGIFKLQNECFAIKDLQMDLLGLYFEFFGVFFTTLIIHNVKQIDVAKAFYIMISDRIYPTPTPQLICAFSIFRERLLLASIDEIMYWKTYLYQKING